MKTLVWTVAMHGFESWSVKENDEQRQNALELWAWRRMLRVSWRDRRTNVWVREKADVREEDGMMEKIKAAKIRKYGHWKRLPDSAHVVLHTIEGETDGKAKRGRRRTTWIDNIAKWTPGGLEEARKRVRKGRVSKGR